MKEQSRYSLETDIEIANELHRLAALFESGETTGDPLVDAVIATTIGSCTGYDYKRRFTELDKFRQTIVVNAGQYAAFRLDQVVCVPSSVPWDPRHSHNCITVIGKLSRQPFFIGNHTRGYKIGVSMELPAILTTDEIANDQPCTEPTSWGMSKREEMELLENVSVYTRTRSALVTTLPEYPVQKYEVSIAQSEGTLRLKIPLWDLGCPTYVEGDMIIRPRQEPCLCGRSYHEFGIFLKPRTVLPQCMDNNTPLEDVLNVVMNNPPAYTKPLPSGIKETAC